MTEHGPKQTIYASLAEIAQGLGHPHRLELIEYLAQGTLSVEQLADISGLSFANTSRHLQILRRARLVEAERQGKYMFYSLAGDSEIVALIKALGCVGERNQAQVKQVMRDYFSAKDALSPISRDELVSRLRADTVTLIDVRPEHEFAIGHLPGALNVPLTDLEQFLAKLPKDQEIVAYCRGPYCVLSFEAIAYLRTRGYTARRLIDGFPEWKAAGLQIERDV